MKKTPLSAQQASGLDFADKTPKWMKDYCSKVYSLLKLQFFTVNIHLVSRRTANKRMKGIGFETLGSNEVAAACVDPVYLTANLFFITPFPNDLASRYAIFHEFLHIKFRYHTFDKVKIALDATTGAELAKLIRIEEETCESMMSVFDSMGVFNGTFF